MDGNKLPRLRLRGMADSNLNRTSQSVYIGSSSAFGGAINKNIGPIPNKIDFSYGAKAFRKKQLVGSLFKGVAEALMITAVFASLLTAGGILISQRFQGRSMPFTYVGNLSIGGKTKSQIKSLLDEHYNQMYITFSEGGLKRQVKLDQLEIQIDTATLAEKAVPKEKNPFAFLNWRRLEVPLKINERYIAGYVERRINLAQTQSEDARLVAGEYAIAIQPEIVGFRSDSKFITQQLKYALSNARVPNIDVTSVTTKPKVTKSDLSDDLSRVDKMLQTHVNIKFGYRYFRPTYAQKLAWLNIHHQSGAKDVNIDFSKGMIRAYIIEQINRYQPSSYTTADGQTKYPVYRIVVDNIDEVADSVAQALITNNQTTQQLVYRNVRDNFTATRPYDQSYITIARR